MVMYLFEGSIDFNVEYMALYRAIEDIENSLRVLSEQYEGEFIIDGQLYVGYDIQRYVMALIRVTWQRKMFQENMASLWHSQILSTFTSNDKGSLFDYMDEEPHGGDLLAQRFLIKGFLMPVVSIDKEVRDFQSDWESTKRARVVLSVMKQMILPNRGDDEDHNTLLLLKIMKVVWDFNHNFVPMDLEIEKEKKKPAESQEIEIEQIEKDTTGKRKKSLPRKRTRSSTKKQKVELDDEKEDLKGQLQCITKSLEEIEAQRTTKILSEMLYDFDIQVLVGAINGSKKVHILLMQNGIAIYMLTEKKYPLSQEMISKMMSKRLEVDQEITQAYELLKFIRSQVKK
ncbi:hypothetical protein Tco_1030525 [Tanacetum coccineum]|uniref:Uncharacterized protein n=1 Tax=Tanacetum coccineum TaxID=301880 RepID=A0ABQ5G843_9ASTR